MNKYIPGDLVLYRETPVVVIAITVDEVTIVDRKSFVTYKLKYKDVTPIPLTQNILYKNTYDEKENKYWVYSGLGYIQYCLSDSFAVKCYTDSVKEEFRYEGLKLEYVHELQHLLDIAHVDKEIIL